MSVSAITNFIIILGAPPRSEVQNAKHPLQQLQDLEMQVLRSGRYVQVREELHVRARER